MCGIVGAFTFNEFRISSEYITRMRDAMIHRGPDGAGVWISADYAVGLGHRRLAIVDLSDAAAQPMLSANGRYVLTFNGEIYNHASIREELKTLGHHHWKTDHSDTEVILHAFQEWGIDCIQKFRGMFAFGLWDEQEKELWLVRDRIGVKPLYYSFHHNRLTFASEIKALLKDPEQHRAVNREAFYHYLSFVTTPAPMTLFAGIQKLEPGTWLKINKKGEVLKKRYWDVWDHTIPITNKSEKEVSERILQELREAVKLRKMSDVPVGVFLSGGVDSSTNTALFSEGSTQPVNTFSIGYEGEYKSYQNELHYAKKMADFVGAKYHERLLTQDDLLDFLPQMVRLQDEPIGDPVCVPVYYVSKLARDNGVIVCQVGEGADELFWGYESWKTLLRLQNFNSVPGMTWLKKGLMCTAELFGKQDMKEYEFLRRSVNHQPIFWGGVDAFTEYQKKSLLSESMKKEFKGLTSWDALQPIWDRFQQAAWDKSPLNWMTYLDLSYRLPELLLMRVDKMSMGVSLEGRVPFLDHKFVELAMSIPAAMKTKGGVSKRLLKNAVRGIIPDELIDRKKQGFGVPVYEWLSDKLGQKIKEEVSLFCKQTDLLDTYCVNQYLNSQFDANAWYLLNVALWWKACIA